MQKYSSREGGCVKWDGGEDSGGSFTQSLHKQNDM